VGAELLQTQQELKHTALARRQELVELQQTMAGKNWAFLVQPALIGAMNVARRMVMSNGALKNPLWVFIGTVLASATALAIGGAIYEVLKLITKVDIDDPVSGEKIKVPLYTLTRKNPKEDAVRWSDYPGLVPTAIRVMEEFGALVAHLVDPRAPRPGKKALDFVFRYAFCNVVTSILSQGGAASFRDLVGGSRDDPHGIAAQVNQFISSMADGFIYNGSNSLYGPGFDIGTSMDRHHDARLKGTARLIRVQWRDQNELAALLRNRVTEGTSLSEALDDLSAMSPSIENVREYATRAMLELAVMRPFAENGLEARLYLQLLSLQGLATSYVVLTEWRKASRPKLSEQVPA
jgi:hypothetical protein